ncbi:MAG: cysteine desulfurase [Chloroflexi bacterium]|nr:cysteine desulfurase [Chloroflexota bacterium]
MIYLDHAATTPVDPAVLDVMLPYLTEQWGNPSGIYSIARQAKQALEEAREDIADVFLCSPNEIVFTGSGSEGANLALKGVAYARRDEGRHIITTQIEHHAVLHTCHRLEREGFEVTYLPVDGYGVVDLDALREAVRPDTILLSLMIANNEVGTIQPLGEAVAAARERNEDIVVHTDAVQAAGCMELDVEELDIDLMSIAAHKFYGPKGVGALFTRRGTPLIPLVQGGGQERNRRSGTENVPYAVGMAKALMLSQEQREERNAHCEALRDRLLGGICESIEIAEPTGHPTQRLPHIASLTFANIEGESVLLNLDMHDVCASAGSACSATSLEPSHVLQAMGIPVHRARGALRLSVGHRNTAAEIERVLDLLPGIVSQLRAMAVV